MDESAGTDGDAATGTVAREEETGPTRVSAWPLVVALGLTVSEIGVFIGIYPLAVGGLVLFVASVAGITHEAGYTERPWRLAGALGIVLVGAGVWMVSTQVPLSTDAVLAAVDAADGIVLRGFSVVGAGLVVVVGAAVVAAMGRDDGDAFPA
jgi:hypothetical protein